MAFHELTIELLGVRPDGARDDSGGEMLRLLTDRGDIRCRLHMPEEEAEAAVVWVFGSGGGLGGPAGGVYERLGRRLWARGVASLQLDYRQPGRLGPCVLDTLVGAAFLEARGVERLALVGHSFGGAVVIRAGAQRESVVAVAALSSQLHGAEAVSELSSKFLLLAHGEDDEVLPADGSRELYRLGRGPRELVLYPGCRHGLDQCRDALDRDLTDWLDRVLVAPATLV